MKIEKPENFLKTLKHFKRNRKNVTCQPDKKIFTGREGCISGRQLFFFGQNGRHFFIKLI